MFTGDEQVFHWGDPQDGFEKKLRIWMKLPKLRGDFWAVEPQEVGIVRLEFKYKRGRLYMNVWEEGIVNEADWGATPCFKLVDPSAKRGVRTYFASWEADECMIHCMIRLLGDDMSVQWIGLFPDGKGYREASVYTKDASRAADRQRRDPLTKFKNMWDGSEPGWKLCTSDDPMYVVELQFDDEGATDEQIMAIQNWIYRQPEDTDATLTERLRGCTGIPIPTVLNASQLEQVQRLAETHGIGVMIQEIAPGNLSPMNPDGREMIGLWLLDPDIVEVLTRKMLEEGILVIERTPA